MRCVRYIIRYYNIITMIFHSLFTFHMQRVFIPSHSKSMQSDDSMQFTNLLQFSVGYPPP